MKKGFTNFYEVAQQWLVSNGPKIVIAVIVLLVGEWIISSLRKWFRNFFLKPKELLIDPAHRISVSSLEPDGYRLLINVWAPAHGFNDAKFALQEKIMNALKQSAIKLPGM